MSHNAVGVTVQKYSIIKYFSAVLRQSSRHKGRKDLFHPISLRRIEWFEVKIITAFGEEAESDVFRHS
jgi:hypothetical protein